MVNFEKLVENFLLEQDEQTSASGLENSTPAPSVNNKQQTSNANDKTVDDQTKQSLSKFISNNIIPVQDVWKKKGWEKSYSLPTNFDDICYNVMYGVKGTTKNVDSFKDVANIFPLLDLIAQLYDNNFKKGQDADKAKNTFKAFIDNINKQNITRPFDYIPTHPWAKTIKEAAFASSKNELGKVRVDQLSANLSLYGTIYELMKIRKKAIFPKLSAFAKMFNGEGVLESIMLKPWEITSGEYAINDDRIKSLYDSTTTQELVNLSLAAYNLYVQQAQNALGEKANTVLKDENTYRNFMGEQNAAPMVWSSTSTQQAQVNASFDQSFELLFKQMLNEVTDPAIISRVKANVGRSAAARRASNFGNPKPIENKKQKDTTQLQAFQTGNQGEYLYSLGELKKASAPPLEHPEAKELLNRLELLADHIKTKESRDWAGAISGAEQLAKGLSLGVPTMGR